MGPCSLGRGHPACVCPGSALAGDPPGRPGSPWLWLPGPGSAGRAQLHPLWGNRLPRRHQLVVSESVFLPYVPDPGCC